MPREDPWPRRESPASEPSPGRACRTESRARSRRSEAGGRPCDRRGGRCAAGGSRGRRGRRALRRSPRPIWDGARARVGSRSIDDGGPSARGEDRGCERARTGADPDARPSRSPRARARPARRPGRPSSTRGRGASPPSRGRRPIAARPGAGGGTLNSPSEGTVSSPSGLATPLATLARNFVRAIPTVTGRPTSSRAARLRRAAISGAEPASRSRPRTSRKASSIERPSTSGVVSSNSSNRSLLACAYADMRGRTTTACGQSWRACLPPMAVRTPNAFAS